MATETLSVEGDGVELATNPQTTETIMSGSDTEEEIPQQYHTSEKPAATGQTNLVIDKVICICGTAMIEGVIQQGEPKCANTMCPSGGTAQSHSGSCYYCPSGTTPKEHPQGFYYCHTCAAAVSKSGFKTTTEKKEVEPFQTSTNKISACTQIRLITWKNYKSQVTRRKCSFCCKMCCPLFFILIMGIVGLMRPFFTFDVNCAGASEDGGATGSCPEIYIAPEQHNEWDQWSLATHNEWSFMPRFLCVENDDDWECNDWECWNEAERNPPHYIGIVWDQTNTQLKPHVESLMNILAKNYESVFDDEYNNNEYIVNDSIGFICNEFSADISNVNWTEGSIVKFFQTEHELEQYVRDDSYGQGGYTFENDASNGALRPLTAAIVFKSVSQDGKIWDYTFRFNNTRVPGTFGNNEMKIVDRVTKNSDELLYSSVSRYKDSGFIGLQLMVDYAITEYIAMEVNNYPFFNTTYLDFIKGYFVFPFTHYQVDIYWTFMQMPFGIFSAIMFIYPVIQIISILVVEKASKIKEGMKMMGATLPIYWTSMYLWFCMEFTFICIIIVAIGYLMSVFLYSNGLIILIWIWLFCMSQMTFSTLISVFFDDPKTATIVGFVLYFVLQGMAMAMSQFNQTQKTFFCLLATPCFMESLNVVVQYESALTGVQWNNIHEHVGQFNMNTCLTMLFVDVILYSLLTLYLDNVWPSRFGQKKSPLFCLFMCCKKRKKDGSTYKSIHAENLRKLNVQIMQNYEDVTNDNNLKNKEPVIVVRNLTKVFGSVLGRSEVVAVNGVSLDIYPGEVFCLLGHNGAGKTTTISMLSGLLSSTDGNAYINGNDINFGMENIRKFLGVCPQHDVLWDLLTAEDHLRFFARLKGVPSDQINYEINRVINLFNMLDSGLWGKFPPNMSGGEKRRLSLAISLIGGSSIVFLDEPTSGMDPENRRKVWDIIEQEKKNRCIILTTHYMDEADILGDRIAIMSSGQIKCCGSSLYLKRLYGVGYSFTVSLKSGTNLEEEKDATLKTEIDNVLSDINGVETVSIAACEILYKLPFEASNKFSNVFQQLDNNKNDLKIETFGVSVTTLEEVFLKIGHHETKVNLNHDNNNNNNEEEKYDADASEMEDLKFEQADFQLEKRNAISIFIIHVYAILYKRFWWSIRDIKGLICQIVLPAALIGLLFGLTSPIQISQKELHLSPDQFVDEYTESVVVPIGKLENDYTINVSNLYYTDTTHNLPGFYYDNMRDLYGNNITYSIGQSASNNMACFGSDTNSDEYYNNNDDGPNCTADFQESIYHYNSDDNTPYYGFYFSPKLNSYNYNQNENEVLFGVNASAYHSLPIALNVWNNWILRNIYDGTDNNAKINIHSYPFPITKTQEHEETVGSAIGMATNLLIAFTLIPASSIYFIVNEKSIGTKHQQFVSGISIPSYWIGSYFSDILLGLPASALTIMLAYIFDVDEFTDDKDAAMALFVSLIFFVSSSIASGYLLHFLFKSAGKAQFIVILFNILLGVVFTIVTQVLDSVGSEKSDDIKSVVRILPIFLLSENILRIVSKPFENPTKTYWDYKVTQRNINYMIYESLGYFALVIIIEYLRSFPSLLAKLGFVVDQPKKYVRLDEDVSAEQERIKTAIDINGNFSEGVLDDTVILAGLRKVYKGENKFSPYKPAVRDMSFGVKQGEVFGFLGTNGAGKTSTLQLLTGENYPSSGIGYINGKSIVNEQLAIRRNIGFCPQNDAIFDLLSAYEHLKFYALIKGLSGKELNKQIKVLLKALTLTKYSKRIASTYSGGNKRKLCVAQAMIGNPPVIFLDEPSTGMDPVSRRFMWKFINQTMKGRAVILTTHSMEECEALCSRVGIMVAGQLSCIGSPQYLKSKFGKGYQLDITIDPNNSSDNNIIHNLLEEFNKTFPTTILQQNGNKILLEIRQYDLDNNDINALGKMFEFVENIKVQFSILSYALSQTSLEQVFLKMAKAKGQIEQQADITDEQKQLLKIIKQETKQELIKRIAILNRDHLEQILENEINNGSQYIVKALMNTDDIKQDQ